MSLYLKYRPKTFADVVGQDHIIDILLAQMTTGKFSHNYLLYGPRGTWKTSTARLLAKMVNCNTFDAEGNPDIINDPATLLIDGSKTLDYIEIDAASHTWVDNIREEIIDKALYPPAQLKKKVYVIDEVHMLSKGAFNALLKIMEEPPEYLLFVLATTEINKVPDTIISRCQVFNFKRLNIDNIVKTLKYIASEEHIEYEEEGLRLIAKLSSGAMRDAIKYLEQVSMLGKVTAAHVSQFLGVVDESVLKDFLEIIEDKTFVELNDYLDKLVEQWTDITHFTKDLLLWIDDHFIENTSFYSILAIALKEIYASIKNYPYPVLLYKSKFYIYFQEHSVEWDTSWISSTWSQIEPQKKLEVIGEKIVSEEESADTKNTVDEQEKSRRVWDLVALKEKILEKIDKVMVKSIVQNHAIIKSFEDHTLTIIVIHENFYATVQKAEVNKYVEDIVSDLVGFPSHITRVYMSKEEYLQSTMVVNT